MKIPIARSEMRYSQGWEAAEACAAVSAREISARIGIHSSRDSVLYLIRVAKPEIFGTSYGTPGEQQENGTHYKKAVPCHTKEIDGKYPEDHERDRQNAPTDVHLQPIQFCGDYEHCQQHRAEVMCEHV